jgi:hypothetical protein
MMIDIKGGFRWIRVGRTVAVVGGVQVTADQILNMLNIIYSNRGPIT